MYASDNTNPTVFIQYWLITYGSTCPSGWIAYSGDCYKNSAATAAPQVSITNLDNISVTAVANAGSTDSLVVAVVSNLYMVNAQDSVVNLAQGWQDAEFNVVGDGAGSAANFNSGSTIVVRTSVNSGSKTALSCSGQGFTGETNNLSFASAPSAQIRSLPAVVFKESSAGGAASACASATTVPGTNENALTDTHDFNGDGYSDILWRDTSGNVAIWLMNDTIIQSAAVVGNVPSSWAIVGQRDFNGDGKADILWRNSNGDVGIWLMNGTQILQSPDLGNVPTSWAIVGTGDFNGDGKADILWRDTSGNVGIWFMNGTTALQTAIVGNVPTSWIVVGSDMKGDIFWRNTSNGDVGMWIMNGATIAQVADFGVVPLSWTVAGIGDFDGNGSFDLLWRDTAGNVGIWLLNGTSILSTAVVGNMPTSSTIAETGSYSGWHERYSLDR